MIAVLVGIVRADPVMVIVFLTILALQLKAIHHFTADWAYNLYSLIMSYLWWKIFFTFSFIRGDYYKK